MVIVRESPRKKPPQSDQQWPPRSPLDALLSSPSGRKKYESRRARNSVSPSPMKRRRLDNSADVVGGLQIGLDGAEDDDEDDEEEDEDEETLQLQLQAIEARLKLKKLQQAKAKSAGKAISERSSEPSSSRPSTSTSLRKGTSRPSEYVTNVNVPVSPIKDRRAPVEERSPARVLLGIDKGLRAQDVSLKRASSTRTTSAAKMLNSQLSRSNSTRTTIRDTSDPFIPRPKTFGERIAESRTNDKEIQAKQDRITMARSRGFGLGQSEPDSTSQPGQYEIQPSSTTSKANQQSTPAHISSSNRKELRIPSLTSRPTPSGSIRPMKATGKQNESEDMSISRDDADSATSTLEAYSGFHLSKRKIDHNTLTRTLQGKSIYSLPRLLKEVKSPDYDPPDCESDYIILGIIASKSTPLDHRTSNPKSIDSAGREENARPKFMVIRLTDLKWELDLFLFDTGFDAFWKLTPGTVVAILNPGIMPPKDRATGAFSLKLSSSEDTVLEIGTSKDLGFCNAIKSNGKECLQWIDGRKTQVCEYHIALKVDKARKGRMQLNTMTNGQGSRDRGSSRGGRGGRGGGRGGLKAEGKQYDSYLHETMYLAPKESGFSATRLLDDRDADVNAWQRGYSREEMQRKRQQARDKEADLAKKLGALGGSAGSEYLKSRADGQARRAAIANPGTQETVTNSGPEPISAESLGLLGKRADDVSLNAVKRKRGPNSGSAPMGWSGAFKTGLPSPIKSARKDPESDQPSPKKKARFMLAEKGIREPGRESLGNIALAPSTDVDYDDDLEIV